MMLHSSCCFHGYGCQGWLNAMETRPRCQSYSTLSLPPVRQYYISMRSVLYKHISVCLGFIPCHSQTLAGPPTHSRLVLQTLDQHSRVFCVHACATVFRTVADSIMWRHKPIASGLKFYFEMKWSVHVCVCVWNQHMCYICRPQTHKDTYTTWQTVM